MKLCVCVCVYIYIYLHKVHTIILGVKPLITLSLSLSLSLYIYIYIYIYTNFVEHNRHFLSKYFLVDPFILPYSFYSIRQELFDVFSIIVYFPSTFCLTLGHHQGRIYYKSDVTFVCTLLLCKKKIIWAVAVCSVYF